MGLMDRLTNWSNRAFGPIAYKDNPVMNAILGLGMNQARWMSGRYQDYAQEGYCQNPYVFACIRQISMAVSGIPWKTYTKPDKKKELDEHPLLDLIHRPNPRQAQGRFFETMIGYLLLDGNSYIVQAGSVGGPPDELYCLRPDRVRIVPGTQAQPIAGYVYSVGGKDIPLPAEQVLHLPLFNPLNDWYGLSPMAAASRSVDQNNQAKSWNMSLLQNGARPTGALSTPLSVEDTQYQRLKEMIAEEYGGFMNSGRPLLLEGGLTWQEMGLSPADMHWLEGQKLDAREIAMVYNIAPELIGDPESKTFSNYQEARKALYEENVLPLMDWLRDDLNAWLGPRYSGGVYLDYDKDEIEALSEDRSEVYERNNAAFVAGWITINDAREDAGKDKDPKYGGFYKWQLPPSAPPGTDPTEEPLPPVVATPATTVTPAGENNPEENNPKPGELPKPSKQPALPAPGGNNPPKPKQPVAAKQLDDWDLSDYQYWEAAAGVNGHSKSHRNGSSRVDSDHRDD